MPIWLIIAYLVFSLPTLYAGIKLNKKGTKVHAKGVLTALIAYSLIFFAIWIFGLKIPDYIIFMPMVSVFVSGFYGHYLGRFQKSKIFDRYLHGYTLIACALFAYYIVENLFVTGGSKAFRALFIFSLGMAMGAMFELMEAAHDVKSRLKGQPDLRDTNMDMAFDLIGSIVAAIFAFIFLL
jgi:uncharacterized membrane protein YjdF